MDYRVSNALSVRLLDVAQLSLTTTRYEVNSSPKKKNPPDLLLWLCSSVGSGAPLASGREAQVPTSSRSEFFRLLSAIVKTILRGSYNAAYRFDQETHLILNSSIVLEVLFTKSRC